MRQVSDAGGHGATGSSLPRRGIPVVLALSAMMASSPAWASYSEGFATLIVLYVGVLVGAGAFVVSLVLCVFGIFRNKIAFITYFALATAGALFIVLIACVDTHGVPFLIAMSVVLVLWTMVVAPPSTQYGLHRRRRRAEIARQKWARFIRSEVDEVNERPQSG